MASAKISCAGPSPATLPLECNSPSTQDYGRKNKVKKLLFTALVVISCAGCFLDSGTIVGGIWNGDRRVQGAHIIIELSLTTTSDVNGYYEINNVPWGEYTVTASSVN
jgi:hypothetical protein